MSEVIDVLLLNINAVCKLSWFMLLALASTVILGFL